MTVSGDALVAFGPPNPMLSTGWRRRCKNPFDPFSLLLFSFVLSVMHYPLRHFDCWNTSATCGKALERSLSNRHLSTPKYCRGSLTNCGICTAFFSLSSHVYSRRRHVVKEAATSGRRERVTPVHSLTLCVCGADVLNGTCFASFGFASAANANEHV